MAKSRTTKREKPKGFIMRFLKRARDSVFENLSDEISEYIWELMKKYGCRLLISLAMFGIWFSERGMKLALALWIPLDFPEVDTLSKLVVIAFGLLGMIYSGCKKFMHDDELIGRVNVRHERLVGNYTSTVEDELKSAGKLSNSTALMILKKWKTNLAVQCTNMEDTNKKLCKVENGLFDKMKEILAEFESQINSVHGIREQQQLISYVRVFTSELQMLQGINQDGLDILE